MPEPCHVSVELEAKEIIQIQNKVVETKIDEAASNDQVVQVRVVMNKARKISAALPPSATFELFCNPVMRKRGRRIRTGI